MNLLTWAPAAEGLLNGVVRCLDGHVHLRNIPPDLQIQFDRLFRVYGDVQAALPPAKAAVADFLSAIDQVKSDNFNEPHIGFTTVPGAILSDQHIQDAIQNLANPAAPAPAAEVAPSVETATPAETPDLQVEEGGQAPETVSPEAQGEVSEGGDAAIQEGQEATEGTPAATDVPATDEQAPEGAQPELQEASATASDSAPAPAAEVAASVETATPAETPPADDGA